jgi:hypothetical protein
MKIIKCKPQIIHRIETDKGEYIRFGKELWYEWIDDSYEYIFDDGELEELFQQQNNRIKDS